MAQSSQEPDTLYSANALRSQRHDTLLAQYGGFYWGSDFIGFAVSIFFTIVFLGIVGAVVGAVGYQLGTAVPKVGGAVSTTTQQLGVGGLIGALVALFLAYFIGGYTAGRMARFSPAKNGLGVVIWTVVVAIILGVLGAIFGNRFNVASQLHLNISTSTLTTAGIISLVVTLVVMLLAAIIGATVGSHYHDKFEQNTTVTS
ncbi:MAG: hypothetical protein M3Z66_13430 [Chloroflexota bacterium]|nr:hypothetical protein [Chloroflexota bacterium]